MSDGVVGTLRCLGSLGDHPFGRTDHSYSGSDTFVIPRRTESRKSNANDSNANSAIFLLFVRLRGQPNMASPYAQQTCRVGRLEIIPHPGRVQRVVEHCRRAVAVLHREVGYHAATPTSRTALAGRFKLHARRRSSVHQLSRSHHASTTSTTTRPAPLADTGTALGWEGAGPPAA